MFSKLTDYELAVLGQETYEKRQWSEVDVRTLRECWNEYTWRSTVETGEGFSTSL
jgi:hypothetical protein